MVSSLLPPAFTPKVQYKNTSLSQRTLVEHSASIVVIDRESADKQLKHLPQAEFLKQQYANAKRSGAATTLRTQDPHSGNFLVLLFIKANASCFEALSAAAKAWKELEASAPESLAITSLGFSVNEATSLVCSVLAAVLAGAAPTPSYKSSAKKSPKTLLNSVSIVGEHFDATLQSSIDVTLATQAGNNLARWLTAQPPNFLNCGNYRTALQQLAKQAGWQAQFFDIAALKKLKAGAFLAVARANATTDAGVMRLRYRAAGKSKAKSSQAVALTLVGKGICFDTGGINLKSHKSMYDMHTDMQGSAVAVGTLLALSQLKVAFDVECWLALTENEIGPNAYRPQEVVTACNGTTIQVVHSDAEGRMALADTLALASRAQPKLIIDFATLTGACVAALSERMSGAFSNRNELRDAIESAGHDSGERVWSFPMDSDYDADLDSPLADIMQCTLDNKADHILAARFLSRFVPESIPWVHIDLSSSSRSGGLAHIPTEITGFGVRWAVEFVKNHKFT